jgi:predicted RNA-binding protein associated with RNAse of E/G family
VGMPQEHDGRERAPLPALPAIHPVRRRTADRRDWALVTRRRFAALRVDEPGFAGHAALLLIDAMTEPLVGSISGVCLADAGYAWLSHFPDGTRHVVTTMVDAAGAVVQWYVDVCRAHGVGADGVPWWDDLYLDVVVRPDGEALLLDEDELALALAHGYVTQEEAALAREEARRLLAAAGSGGALSPAQLAPRSAAHLARLRGAAGARVRRGPAGRAEASPAPDQGAGRCG